MVSIRLRVLKINFQSFYQQNTHVREIFVYITLNVFIGAFIGLTNFNVLSAIFVPTVWNGTRTNSGVGAGTEIHPKFPTPRIIMLNLVQFVSVLIMMSNKAKWLSKYLSIYIFTFS
jgi:hypothetical protein